MIIAVKQLLNNEHALCFNILFHYWLVLALFFISYLFQFFSLILVFFTPVIFLNFVSFTFNTISILSISHFTFLLNFSVFLVYFSFSLCARLNWQFVCQFLSANL